MTEFRCEILPNVPWHMYVGIDALNPSTAVHGRKSLKHLRHAMQHPKPDTAAMRIGTIAHELILEGQLGGRFAFYDGVRNEKHARYQAFLELFPNADVISKSEYAAARRIAAAVTGESALATETLSGCTTEVTLLGELEGVQCKGRVDALRDGHLVDLKVTRDISRFPFGRVASQLGYMFKLEMYRQLLDQNLHTVERVTLITVEQDEPNDVAVVPVPLEWLDHQTETVQRVIADYRHATETNHWTGIAGEQPYELWLPAYDRPEAVNKSLDLQSAEVVDL